MSNTERRIVVFKFGSSVLRDREVLPEVVSEIYRAVRAGKRVVAVTSAFMGVTDELIKDSIRFGCPHENVNAPSYIATGEENSAALVALACDRSGLCSVALKTPELGILAAGPSDDAEPLTLQSPALSEALDAHDVVVVPGFVASDARGRTVLLGRGGSDLTAVFLADMLGAERVRLVKDVDGVYDRDPARARGALRFERIDWNTAKAVAGRLIQMRALEYAQAKSLTIEIGEIGSDTATVIGPALAAPTFQRQPKKLRIGLAGYGVVGAGVAARLMHLPKFFEIVSVLVRDPVKEREGAVPQSQFVTQMSGLLDAQPDVIVDALSCASAGAELTETALQKGISVVSANKQAVALWLRSHDFVAPCGRGELLYSAAVGGGAPLLEAIKLARAEGAEIVEIAAVLNGTVNFVLEALARGLSLEAALAQAKRSGLAEENPAADLSGMDALAKLGLVSLAAFDACPAAEDVSVEALDQQVAAVASSCRLRQMARLVRKDDTFAGKITFEPAVGGPFADLEGDRNAIRIVAVDGRVWTARGRGAGRWPTTESVFSDLRDLSNLGATLACDQSFELVVSD